MKQIASFLTGMMFLKMLFSDLQTHQSWLRLGSVLHFLHILLVLLFVPLNEEVRGEHDQLDELVPERKDLPSDEVDVVEDR